MVGTAEQSGKLYTKGEYFCLLGLCWCGALSRNSGAVSCCSQPGNSCPFPQPVKPFVSWFAASGASLVVPEQFSREKSKAFRKSLFWFGCCHLGAWTDFNNILHNSQVMWIAELSCNSFFDSEICSFFPMLKHLRNEVNLNWIQGCEVAESIAVWSSTHLEDFNSSNWAAAITSPAFSKSYLWSHVCLSS